MKRFRPCVAMAFVLVTAFAALAAAQPSPAARPQDPNQPAGPPAGTPTLKLYHLKHTSATELVATLQAVLGAGRMGRGGPLGPPLAAVRITAVDRTNSVVVFGSPEEHATVEALVKNLDVEGPARDEPAGRQVDILPLGSIEPDADLEKALRLVFDARGGGFALDRQRRVVVLSGDRQLRTEAERVIKTLDGAQAVRRDLGDMRVRVVWLVSGLKREDAAAAPQDLGEVTTELAKLGIDKPRLAAQVIVNAPLNAPFHVEGSAKLDHTCRLHISGTLSDRKDALGLEIEIGASRDGEAAGPGFGGRGNTPVRGAQICSLRTQITTPPGHAVVLGVTPTDGMTSVFVVQVLLKERKPDPRKGR